MLSITMSSAMWFFPLAGLIGVWAAISDLKRMKIPNRAVLALVGVFVVVGLIALPFAEYPWRLLQLVVVLVIGFVLNMVGAVGAGDAKFAAAMAPFIALGDSMTFLTLFAAVMLAAFVIHRLFRRIPAIRRLTPEWESWENNDFPMGLALGGSLVFYLGLGILYGS
ncbi:prepilin peptidase [Cochlodiniinecator piscidefendens]|uniref:prepilin peptidase n=1 Tax=Cochlodiniinecator piscidefendens TaxID=2715756 RepID=UPI00140DFFAF|nr:prepilin peptidase [Cochlodiniinecator piscidefendens]